LHPSQHSPRAVAGPERLICVHAHPLRPYCCRYPSRCASLPARPSSDPAAFRRPRSLPCTVLESRSPGAGTLTSSPLVFLVFGDICPATTQLHGAPARRFAAPFPLLQLMMAATSVYCDLCASRCCGREVPPALSCAVPVPSTSCFPVSSCCWFPPPFHYACDLRVCICKM
jgi:hypothetical protein